MTDLLAAYNGFWTNESISQRSYWERARMIAFYASAPHVKTIKKPTDIIVFGWEKSNLKGSSSNKWTKEEINEMIKNGTHPLIKQLNNGT